MSNFIDAGVLRYASDEQPKRPSRERTWLEVAEVFARRSTCSRLSVGAVVTDEEMLQALGVGYNGSARGLKNGCMSDVPGSCGCVHAELNALLKAPGIQKKMLFTTVAPCIECAKAALNTNVVDVFFLRHYRSTEGLALLYSQDVGLWTPSGATMTPHIQPEFISCSPKNRWAQSLADEKAQAPSQI